MAGLQPAAALAAARGAARSARAVGPRCQTAGQRGSSPPVAAGRQQLGEQLRLEAVAEGAVPQVVAQAWRQEPGAGGGWGGRG